MITEWMKNHTMKIDELKIAREGAYFRLDEHRGSCQKCNASSIDKILKGTCADGIVAARQVNELNNRIAGK